MIHLATQQKLTQRCKLILNNKTIKCNKINFKYKIKINFKNKNSLKKGEKKKRNCFKKKKDN